MVNLPISGRFPSKHLRAPFQRVWTLSRESRGQEVRALSGLVAGLTLKPYEKENVFPL